MSQRGDPAGKDDRSDGGGAAARGSATHPSASAAGEPDLDALRARVHANVPGLEDDSATVGLPAFRAEREGLLEAAQALRALAGSPLDYLTCLSGVDYPDRIEVVYHLFSIQARLGLVLKVSAPKERGAETGREPAGDEAAHPRPVPEGTDARPWLPSVTPVWAGADWHEREVFDLLGVEFRGHPDLRRILMPEGFDGGYPLRKDYVDQREQRARKVRAR